MFGIIKEVRALGKEVRDLRKELEAHRVEWQGMGGAPILGTVRTLEPVQADAPASVTVGSGPPQADVEAAVRDALASASNDKVSWDHMPRDDEQAVALAKAILERQIEAGEATARWEDRGASRARRALFGIQVAEGGVFVGVKAYGNRVLVVETLQNDSQRTAIALPVGARVERLRRGVVVADGDWRGDGAWAPPQAGDLIYYDDAMPPPAQCYTVGDQTAVPLDAIVAIDSVAGQA